MRGKYLMSNKKDDDFIAQIVLDMDSEELKAYSVFFEDSADLYNERGDLKEDESN